LDVDRVVTSASSEVGTCTVFPVACTVTERFINRSRNTLRPSYSVARVNITRQEPNISTKTHVRVNNTRLETHILTTTHTYSVARANYTRQEDTAVSCGDISTPLVITLLQMYTRNIK